MKKFLKILFFIFIAILIFSLLATKIFCRMQNNKNKKSLEFTTLQNIQDYANSYPENVISDNKDWEDPIFKKFYNEQFRSTFIKKILELTCLEKKYKFDPIAFKNILEKVTNSRISTENNNNSNIKLELNPGDKLIIFGDLQAALHSFIRDLQELKNLGYIDQNLKIIPKNLYIIIIGDAINKNPYSLETLNIILLLMDKNPDRVIYNKGKHEINENWENYQIITELKTKAESLSQDIAMETPLKNELNKFFDTLCDSIIITNKSKKNIKSKLFTNQDKIIITHSKCKPELLDKNTKLIIFGEKKFDILKESSGLEFIGYQQGAATWSTLSCPTPTYQKFFNFHKDAFIEVIIGQSAKTSTLALYNHDVRNNQINHEYKKTLYNPIFGYKIADNKDNILSRNIYNIGSTMAITGITGPLGHENKIGLETAIYFNNLNNENSLIKPTIFNDDNTPKIALSNAKNLIKNYNINTLIIPTGNTTLLLYLDMIKSGKISVLFPCDGGEQFRKKELKNIVHFRPSYEQEIKHLINYLVSQHGVKNFAFFYQDDSYGEPMAKTAHEELKKLGITKWLDLPHLRSESDFEYTIKEIRKKMPEAIGCFSSQFPTKEFINQLGGEFFSGRLLFGPSFLYSQALEKFLQTRGINSIFSTVVPDPFENQIELIKEFRDQMNARGLAINCNTLEGYISGALISNAISKIQKPFTKEKIIEYFENMSNYKFKGLNLTFNPETRDLSQPIFIRKLNNKLIKYSK